MTLQTAIVLAAFFLAAGPTSSQKLAARFDESLQKNDVAAVEQAVRASIGWALTKDRELLESLIAHDPELFIFHPDSKSTVVGWDAFAKNFGLWMDPRFKATSFDVRDLRIRLSQDHAVAWFSAMLDDLAEWEGKPVGWRDTRWTGVLEKRDGRWVIVQMHFSFASDRQPQRLPPSPTTAGGPISQKRDEWGCAPYRAFGCLKLTEKPARYKSRESGSSRRPPRSQTRARLK
jgi:ketosteroid isomerase-like protein